MHTFSLTAADEKHRFILHREDKNIIQPACVWRNLSALAPKSQQMRSELNSSEPTTASCSTDHSLPFVSHYMGWITPQPGHWGEVLASQHFGRLGFDSSFDERSKQSLFSKHMCLFICPKKRILQRCHGENTTTGFIWAERECSRALSWGGISLSGETSGLGCWAQHANHVGQRQNVSKFVDEPALWDGNKHSSGAD